ANLRRSPPNESLVFLSFPTLYALSLYYTLEQWFPTGFDSWTPNGLRALSVDPASICQKVRK
ncbi:Hypothetical protein FKW44_022851, partial [Caligus rogercresseyi]